MNAHDELSKMLPKPLATIESELQMIYDLLKECKEDYESAWIHINQINGNKALQWIRTCALNIEDKVGNIYFSRTFIHETIIINEQ